MMELPILSPDEIYRLNRISYAPNADETELFMSALRGVAQAQRDQDQINALRWFVEWLDTETSIDEDGRRVVRPGAYRELKDKLAELGGRR